MRVLVACEFSGIVRDAFNALPGAPHFAMSCDLLPSERPGPHYQGDVRDVLHLGWDLMIAFPPCTYLAVSGAHWALKRPERVPLREEAIRFVRLLAAAPIARIAIENPISILSTRWRPPTQVIHPHYFGHEASKATCLWLQNLPRLLATDIVDKGEFYQCKDGSRMAKHTHRISGRDKVKRAQHASRTFPGVAQAMALQWGTTHNI